MTEVTPCPICGQDVTNEVGRRGRRRLYCSRRCNDQATRNRTSVRIQEARKALGGPCENCGAQTPVPTRGLVPRFCSVRCCNIFAGRVLPEAYPARTCALDECAAVFVPKHKNQLCCSELHGNRHWKMSNPRPKDRMTPARQRALRRKTQLRRARMTDPNAEVIDRDEIGNRDGWRCGLCHKLVDRTLLYPDPLSPSLDHIEPLSKGGKHVRENVQTSHLRCNVAKNNRGGGEQLLLIG